MPVTLRGTAIQPSTSGTSVAIAWPSGTVAGDLAILFASGSYSPTSPSGWTVLGSGPTAGSNWNGGAWSKVLTSADITAGSVSVSWGGSADVVLAIATFALQTTSVVGEVQQQNASGSSSVALSAASISNGASAALYFGSNRALSVDTVNAGTLQQQGNDGATGSACLYFDSSPPGAISPTFSYSVAGSGNYQAVVALMKYPFPTAPSVGTPVTNANVGANHQKMLAPAAMTPTTSGGGNSGFTG